ncbi:MAG: transcriptional regulator [Proteobacteria bacterium]|nr:transcriptional regulator [Pseudomonadota bacterium]
MESNAAMNEPVSTITTVEVQGHLLPGKVACQDCSLFQLCLPVGIDQADLAEVDSIIKRHRPIQRGDQLFASGDKFRSIYAVRSGSLKTSVLTEDGREQVTGFFLPGEIVGLDAIGTDEHTCTARALETTGVCEIPYDELESIGERIPSLPRQLLRIMSREMHHDQLMLLLLGKRSADERLAAFLFSLSQRFGLRGYSPNEFNLSMSRNDIGNYLGLAVETVSRLFSRLQEDGILLVHSRHVQLRDIARLQALAGI